MNLIDPHSCANAVRVMLAGPRRSGAFLPVLLSHFIYKGLSRKKHLRQHNSPRVVNKSECDTSLISAGRISTVVAVCRHFRVQVSCVKAPLELVEIHRLSQQGKFSRVHCLNPEPFR